MKKAFQLSVLCSAIALAACSDSPSSSGTSNTVVFEDSVQALLGRDTSIKFHLNGVNKAVPLPSYLLMDTSDGSLGIPTGGNNALSNPLAAMNTMDGWSTSMPISLEFTGAGFTDGPITSGVSVIKLSKRLTDPTLLDDDPTAQALTQNVDFVVVASGNRLNIVFSNNLDESSEYIFAITDAVTDKNGNPVGTTGSYASAKTTTVTYTEGPLASVQQATKGTEAIFALNGVSPANIVYSSWFSTQSVGDTLAAVKGITATGFSTGSNTLNTIYKNSANPGSVDLSTAYAMSFGTTQDFSDALNTDADFDKYIARGDSTRITESKTAINGLYTAAAVNVSVTQGSINLPHYLEKGANWASQPMTAAMPNLVKLLTAMKNPADLAVITQQLTTGAFASNPVDLPNLATSPVEQMKLVGTTITLADGSQLDPQREISRYSPVPEVKSLENVEFLLFTPKDSTATDVVIYQHGITSAKENAYAFAFNMVKKGLAVIAIDAPLHGTRSLDDQRSANSNVLAYLNLSNLPVGRDNLRQSMLDILGLRAGLVISKNANLLSSSPLSGYDPASGSKVKLLGHSLGGIIGTSAFAAAKNTLGNAAADALFSFSSASLQNTSGQIANIVLGSNEYGPLTKHNVALTASSAYKAYADQACSSLSAAACYTHFETNATAEQRALLGAAFTQFGYATQTVMDTIDPFTNASDLLSTGSLAVPVLMTQVDQDGSVPNTVANAPFAGTEALAGKLGLKVVDSADNSVNATASFVKFNNTAVHSTFISPQINFSDLSHFNQMQAINADFLENDSLDIDPDAAVLK